MPSRWNQEDRARIAKLVRAHRGALRLGVDAIAERAPMSPVTWGRVEAGEAARVATYAGVEAAFGWPLGTIARYVDNGEEPPEPGKQPTPPPAVDTRHAMQANIDLVLASDLPDARKLHLIRALREVETLREAEAKGRDGTRT